MSHKLSGFISKYGIDQDSNGRIRHNFIISSAGALQSSSKKTVIDLGCGYGTLGKFFERRGNVVYYADINAESLRGLDCLGERIRCDARHLPFKDRSFHVVLCSDVLEHIHFVHRDSCLSELMRIAKEHLLLTFSTFSSTTPGIQLFEKQFKLFNLQYPDWYYEHNASKSPTLSHVRRFLETGSFKVVDEKKYQGLLGIFLTGLFFVLILLRSKYRFRTFGWVAMFITNTITYFLVSKIDLPPYCSFFLGLKRNSKHTHFGAQNE